MHSNPIQHVKDALAAHATSKLTRFQSLTLLCLTVLKSQVQDIEGEKKLAYIINVEKREIICLMDLNKTHT